MGVPGWVGGGGRAPRPRLRLSPWPLRRPWALKLLFEVLFGLLWGLSDVWCSLFTAVNALNGGFERTPVWSRCLLLESASEDSVSEDYASGNFASRDSASGESHLSLERE